jgi:ferredoxin
MSAPNDAPAPLAVHWLTREALDTLLARAARDGALIGPVELDGEVVFAEVDDPRRLTRDYVNSLVPPKDHFLPNPEPLVAYRIEQGKPVFEPADVAAERERLFFGIRSCDVAGLAYLERFLSGAPFGRPDTADGPFLQRRKAVTLLSVACQLPGETCMCVCCEGGPSLVRGYDWQLTECERGWLVEVGSARGEALAARSAELLEPVPDGALAERDARMRAAIERFHASRTRRVPTMAAARMVSQGRLPRSFWNAVGERCAECGGCAYVCPTCSCFNVVDMNAAGAGAAGGPVDGIFPAVPGGITDQVRDGRYERVRMRDNCILPGFVRQAGGGYPRWTCGERCVTRFFHKLSWQFHARMEASGCTGCGRCAQVCLGEEGIDRVAIGMVDAMRA